MLINLINENEETASLPLIQKLIESGVDIDYQDSYNRIALDYAKRRGLNKVFDLLIQNGANYQINTTGISPLNILLATASPKHKEFLENAKVDATKLLEKLSTSATFQRIFCDILTKTDPQAETNKQNELEFPLDYFKDVKTDFFVEDSGALIGVFVKALAQTINEVAGGKNIIEIKDVKNIIRSGERLRDIKKYLEIKFYINITNNDRAFIQIDSPFNIISVWTEKK